MIFVWLVAAIILFVFGFVVLRGAPYVPSQRKYIRQAFMELYPISKSDVLVDIGSGDGVVLREASKLDAKSVGYEINPILILISKLLSLQDKNISVRFVDFWLSHLPSDTTVVYVFATSSIIKKIKVWLQNETNNLDRPIYLISYGFKIVGMNEQKKVGAYYLYRFNPLHTD